MAEDPREQGPKPPHPSQKQSPPGLESEMDPPPDYGEDSYEGSGKLEGKAAVITGLHRGETICIRSSFSFSSEPSFQEHERCLGQVRGVPTWDSGPLFSSINPSI